MRKVLKSMPEEYKSDKNLMMRYIYINACIYYAKDTRFFYGTDSSKEIIYNRKIDPKNFKGRNIICKSLATIIVDSFNEVGIKAKTISKKDTNSPFPHIDIIAEGNNDKKYYMNPLDDLFRAQIGLKTKSFASKTRKYPDENLSYMEDEEIQKYDDKIGYTYKGIYTDTFFELLKGEFQNRRKLINFISERDTTLTRKDLNKSKLLEEKLDFLFQYVNLRSKYNGYIELKNYIKYIENNLLTKPEKKAIQIYNLKSTNKGNKKYMACLKVNLTKNSNESTYYVFTNKNSFFAKMDADSFIDFLGEHNLILGKDKALDDKVNKNHDDYGDYDVSDR